VIEIITPEVAAWMMSESSLDQSLPSLEDLVNRPAWMKQAACRGRAELYFPERGESTREAKELCQGCVVRQECLEYAVTGGELDGIWGGLSTRGRRKQRSVA
jgi:WhiB family transcriptional regulator, redox-sensing transcriptional regulator